MDFYTQWWIVVGVIFLGVPLIISMVAVAPAVWDKLVEWITAFMALLSRPFQPKPPVTTKAERNAKELDEWQEDFNRLAGAKHTYASGCRCEKCVERHTGTSRDITSELVEAYRLSAATYQDYISVGGRIKIERCTACWTAEGVDRQVTGL